MDWGTKESVANDAAATDYVARLKERFPEQKSAYVPSGRLPIAALVWLGLGAGIGVPAGAIAGSVLGGISLLLVLVIGFLLSAMASICGRVLCIAVVLELVVAVGGAGITFAGVGAAPAWVVAWMGKHGKNRNAWAATALTLPAALLAFVIIVAIPQIAAALVGPADPADDFALSTLVHLLSDPGWMTLALYGLGFIITMGTAAFVAHDTVGQQKFCEACERYMDQLALPGMSFDVGAWAIDAVRRGGAAEIAPQIPREGGRDIEAKVFACPNCASGFFEAHTHVLAEWPAPKGGTDTRTEQWLCASIPTISEHTRALLQAKNAVPT